MSIGIVAHGPELRTTAAYGAINRIGDLLEPYIRTEGYLDLEIIFNLPGSLGAPDFVGVRVGRVSLPLGRIQVHIAVPTELINDDAPDLKLIDLVERAVSAGMDAARAGGGAIDIDSWGDAVASAAEAVRSGGPFGPLPLTAQEIEEDRILAQAMADLGIPTGDTAVPPAPVPGRAGLQVDLTTPDGPSLDAAFALERDIAMALETSGAGYVDGNEVGEGTFTIYAYGPDAKRLRQVTSAALSTWRRADAFVTELNE